MQNKLPPPRYPLKSISFLYKLNVEDHKLLTLDVFCVLTSAVQSGFVIGNGITYKQTTLKSLYIVNYGLKGAINT